jgi:hypothetical protein
MNELIKLKNKYKYKQYNLIPDKSVKTSIIVNDVIEDIIDEIIKDNICSENTIVCRTYNPNITTVIEENECRICFEEETVENPFIWPCRCKGTSKFVHSSCLNRWRNENIDHPAFELCMECRYKYRFKHQFPYEFRSQIEVHKFCTIVAVILCPFIFTYFMTQIDKMNDEVILKTIIGKNNNITSYINKNPETYNSISYCVYYDTILFLQSLLFMSFYILYCCKYVYRKKTFLKKQMQNWGFYTCFIFKFPLLYLAIRDSTMWLTIFITLSTVMIFFEPIFYIVTFLKHNKILFEMDLINDFTLRNYEESLDLEYTRQRRLNDLIDSEYLSGIVITP